MFWGILVIGISPLLSTVLLVMDLSKIKKYNVVVVQ
jgi:hypothetical protein